MYISNLTLFVVYSTVNPTVLFVLLFLLPAIELITELMQSEVRLALLRGLVAFLKPTKERNPKQDPGGYDLLLIFFQLKQGIKVV